jgi:NFU1 iron-sulfur cluster scaffold homolog, mitochondrial
LGYLSGFVKNGRRSLSDLKERVAQVLSQQIAPALAMDGTQMEVLDVQGGVARIRLGGVCGSCPSSIMAVVMGIEQELRRLVPEVECLEAVP